MSGDSKLTTTYVKRRLIIRTHTYIPFGSYSSFTVPSSQFQYFKEMRTTANSKLANAAQATKPTEFNRNNIRFNSTDAATHL